MFSKDDIYEINTFIFIWVYYVNVPKWDSGGRLGC